MNVPKQRPTSQISHLEPHRLLEKAACDSLTGFLDSIDGLTQADVYAYIEALPADTVLKGEWGPLRDALDAYVCRMEAEISPSEEPGRFSLDFQTLFRDTLKS